MRYCGADGWGAHSNRGRAQDWQCSVEKQPNMSSPFFSTRRGVVLSLALLLFLIHPFVWSPLPQNASFLSCHTTSTSMAARDTLGFFQDWPDELWKIQKQISLARKHEYPRESNLRNTKPEPIHHWYQKNWDPDFSCPAEDKIGNMGDGHKWVCDPHRIASQKDCLVYSIGSNGQFDFEEGIQQRLPFCEIHIFDFTDYSRRVPKGLNVTYHAWGLKPSYSSNNIPGRTPKWESDTASEWKSLPEIVEILGHSDRLIEIFKIDCEGCEWYTYKDWLRFNIRQIMVETHRTPPNVNDFFSDIHAANFVMFHKEANILGTRGNAIEFSFLKMNGSFFEDEE